MVAKLVGSAVVLILLCGCGSGPKDLSKVDEQPAANLEAGASAQTIEQWAASNPNNGAPGSGEQAGK
ncbi:MAG TPA: hypothetical protein PKA27_05935 [Fimbriimonadaceae bacterium]|nr:hypothetical protein [Fimbriimonadaceae bacterium]